MAIKNGIGSLTSNRSAEDVQKITAALNRMHMESLKLM
jgi:hypothetical protein